MKIIPLRHIDHNSSLKSKQWPQFFAVLTASLSSVGVGIYIAWTSPAIPILLTQNYSLEELSFIPTFACLGYLIGAPLISFIVDRIGRKNALLYTTITQIFGWLIIANANTIELFYIARFITGISECSIFMVLPMYVGEICEPKIRGILGTVVTLSLVFGALLICCYGPYVSISTGAYISMSIPVLFYCSFIWMPESPYYYLLRNKKEEAKSSLRKLRGLEYVEEEFSALTAAVEKQMSEPGSIRDIFTVNSNRKAFFILLGLRTFQQFSGFSAMAVYTQTIFELAGGMYSSSVSSIIYISTQFVSTMFSSILVGKFGRKSLLILSSFGTSAALVIEGFYFYYKDSGTDVTHLAWLPVTIMMCYIFMLTIGMGVIPNIMMGELLPANVKAKSLAITNIWFAICISMSTKLLPTFEQMYGMCVPLFIFATSAFINGAFSYYFVPETKNKSLEEIQQKLKRNKSKKHVKEVFVIKC